MAIAESRGIAGLSVRCPSDGSIPSSPRSSLASPTHKDTRLRPIWGETYNTNEFLNARRLSPQPVTCSVWAAPNPTKRSRTCSHSDTSPLLLSTCRFRALFTRINPATPIEPVPKGRCLTEPSAVVHAAANENFDLVLHVNDVIKDRKRAEDEGYEVLGLLGTGSLGQVAKCRHLQHRRMVAIKVVRASPAYTQHGGMEVAILKRLTQRAEKLRQETRDSACTLVPGPYDNPFVTFHEAFFHGPHLCIVMELLFVNLYDLLRANSHRGLSMLTVRQLAEQITRALYDLHAARLVHCDVKPENIALVNSHTSDVKLIDFGSARPIGHALSTTSYVQSRYYRAPEVILGAPQYRAAMDMWSLGCTVAELFLGLPLLPGTDNYQQFRLLISMCGAPNIEEVFPCCANIDQFFNRKAASDGRSIWELKTLDDYYASHQTPAAQQRRYFNYDTLDELIANAPLSAEADAQAEAHDREQLTDWLHGLLCVNPKQRWTAELALQHPWLSGSEFDGACFFDANVAQPALQSAATG
eukprot:NODE_264_length_1774_cov_131.281117_g237_i0.p1 GENE.NODE_264_length_1774_cov_131.281117_g237_i0~~NODE_264_length_1774_cov_131.281117_g237_i0.p1  ORF type:complete len:527 (+),score=49.73 NODE_264_length_1774_cov_131.281117_g237_i0:173-1753(+)